MSPWTCWSRGGQGASCPPPRSPSASHVCAQWFSSFSRPLSPSNITAFKLPLVFLFCFFFWRIPGAQGDEGIGWIPFYLLELGLAGAAQCQGRRESRWGAGDWCWPRSAHGKETETCAHPEYRPPTCKHLPKKCCIGAISQASPLGAPPWAPPFPLDPAQGAPKLFIHLPPAGISLRQLLQEGTRTSGRFLGDLQAARSPLAGSPRASPGPVWPRRAPRLHARVRPRRVALCAALANVFLLLLSRCRGAAALSGPELRGNRMVKAAISSLVFAIRSSTL